MNARALLATGAVASVAIAAPGASAADTPPVNLLFVQSAPSATVKPLGHDSYRLTLNKVQRGVPTFSDRPNRVVGQESIEQFVAKWKQRGFDTDPPNAALVVDGGKRDADTLVVALTEPKLDGKGQITYLAKHIDPPTDGALAANARQADDHLPRRTGAVHLFIDDAPATTQTGFQVSIAGTGRVNVIFNNATISTPPPLTQSGVTFAINGFGVMGPNLIQFSNQGPTYNGAPAGVSAGILVNGTEVRGTLSLPDGVESAQITVGGINARAQTVGPGPFTIPLT
jgi:hypothetical protein